MLKILVAKKPLTEYEHSEGFRYGVNAEFRTDVDESSDAKSVIQALYEAMILEGYSDYGIIDSMFDFVSDNIDIIQEFRLGGKENEEEKS